MKQFIHLATFQSEFASANARAGDSSHDGVDHVNGRHVVQARSKLRSNTTRNVVGRFMLRSVERPPEQVVSGQVWALRRGRRWNEPPEMFLPRMDAQRSSWDHPPSKEEKRAQEAGQEIFEVTEANELWMFFVSHGEVIATTQMHANWGTAPNCVYLYNTRSNEVCLPTWQRGTRSQTKFLFKVLSLIGKLHHLHLICRSVAPQRWHSSIIYQYRRARTMDCDPSVGPRKKNGSHWFGRPQVEETSPLHP